jgi:hypothetical protein
MDSVALCINEYNTTQEQLVPLQDAETQMHAVDSQVATASSSMSRRQALLSKTIVDDAKLQKRIYRNAKPRFLHFLVCNREAKVERLKRELDELVTIEQDLSNKISTDSALLSTLQQQQCHAHALVDSKHQLESRCRILFDEVVDSQPPTQCLQDLHANLQQQSVLLVSEKALLQEVSQSVAHLQQGLARFHRAGDLYRQAAHINERAKRVNERERHALRDERRAEFHGNDMRAANAEWRAEKLDREERHLQGQRDSLINQANDMALRAYDAISTAFSTFPMGVHARYPQLCISIGQVAFPRVEGANFSSALMADAIFGTWGAAMNDFSSGCKIERNMSVVEQCVSKSSYQLGLITAVDNSVRAAIQQIEASVRELDQGILLERTRIFNVVRVAVYIPTAA